MIKLGFLWCLALATVGTVYGTTGCTSAKDAYDCAHICNRYKECFDSNYDVDACSSKCRDNADKDTNYSNKAEDCQNCEDDASCAGAAFGCAGNCVGIVP